MIIADGRSSLIFATDIGGKTSHTAIMARALQIPAVVGLKDVSTHIEDGVTALLDGYNGLLIVNPTDQTLYEYGQIVQKHVNFRLGRDVNAACRLVDNQHFRLQSQPARDHDFLLVAAA